MTNDPLAQYRKTPLASGSAPRQKEPDEYLAFAGKDKAVFLEIRRAMAPTRSPRNNLLIDVAFDGPYGTNFVIHYTFMVVVVTGRNLQDVIFAVQNCMATFIQEFDPDRWDKPKDEKAAVIESIDVYMQGSSPDKQGSDPTRH